MIESVNVCAKLYSYAEQTKELKKKRKQKVLKNVLKRSVWSR